MPMPFVNIKVKDSTPKVIVFANDTQKEKPDSPSKLHLLFIKKQIWLEITNY